MLTAVVRMAQPITATLGKPQNPEDTAWQEIASLVGGQEHPKNVLMADISAANALTGETSDTVHKAVEELLAQHRSTVPEAAGRSAFPAEQYRVAGDDLREVAAAIAQKSGIPAPVWPEGFAEAVAGIEAPVPVYYTPGGKCYLEHMTVAPMQGASATNELIRLFSGCTNLKTVVTRGGVYTGSNGSMFENCTSLTHASCENFAAYGHYVFRNCHALQAAQLGSLGVPVTSMTIYTFYGCAQADLEITLYVDAQTLAEIPSGVTGAAPWGAANATIIYRNSTTGEVLEV